MGEKCGGEMEKAKWKTFNTAGMQDLITNVYVQPELSTTANIHENGLIDQIIISVFKKWECVLPLLPPVLLFNLFQNNSNTSKNIFANVCTSALGNIPHVNLIPH